MTKSVAYIRRTALTACAAAAILGQVGTAPALSLDIEEITAVRAERKRANSDGKLPLPGTPDLKRFDDRLAERGVDRDAPIFIRVFKAESEMEVWTGDENGTYSLFATYPICYWSGTLGPKLKEGDKQAPEGFYTVTMEQSIHDGNALAEVAQHRLPQPLRSGEPALGLAHPHSRRLRLDRLLRHDQRRQPRGLQAGDGRARRRPAEHSRARISVPHDGGELRQVRHAALERFLAEPEGRLRPLRAHRTSAARQRMRHALRLRRVQPHRRV